MRRLLFLVGAIVFVDTMFFAALTPLLPHYTDELGLGKAGAGILQAAYPAGTFLGAVPSGIVAARLGVKPTVLGGLATLAVTSLAFGAGHALQGLDAAVATAALGFVWGVVYLKRRSAVAPSNTSRASGVTALSERNSCARSASL